jgi:molybdopterin converting factor small subunit
MRISVEFVGSLRHASCVRTLIREGDNGMLLKDLVYGVIKEKPALEHSLLDKQLDDPKASALILINGREISVLQGLSTELKDGDKIVFVPVVHGG